MPITLDGSLGITTPMYNGSITANAVTPVTGFKNRIINGQMTFDQRNAGAVTTPTNGQYFIDRYYALQTTAGKFTTQLSSTAPSGFASSLLCTSTSAFAVGAGDIFGFAQKIEAYNTSDLMWGTASAKTITLSFQVYSSLTGTFGGALQNGAQNYSYPFTYSIPVANTWTTISVTIAGPTAGTWISNTNGTGLVVFLSVGTGTTNSGTAGAWTGTGFYSATGATSVVGTNGATFYITGVQLEVGSTATSFDYRPYGTELALCQRYYETGITGAGTRSGDNYGVYAGVFKVTKRANPTVTYVATGAAGGLGGYYLGPNQDGFVGYSTSAAAGNAYYFTYTAAIEL